MKLILFILLISLSLSLSKKKDKKTTKPQRSSSSESDASNENPRLSGVIVDDDDYRPHQVKRSEHGYFNSKGTLRNTFALEQAFQNSGSNVVSSPISALIPLGKLVFGAEEPTKSELLHTIGERKTSELAESFKKLIKHLKYVPGVKLHLCSRIYVSEELEVLGRFNDAVKDIFHSGMEKISFKSPKTAADEINGWISRQTSGMINLLLQPNQISPMASMIIVNAIYFKGKWKDPFDFVFVGDFFSPTGLKKVQLMSRSGNYRYAQSGILNAEILEIPYDGKEATFVIVLPNEKISLHLLLNQLKLAPSLLNTAMKKLEKERVKVTIPKFSITSSLDLKDMYQKIGMKHTVSSNPGFTDLVRDKNLTITSGIQKAVIEVHERGTEASAASGIIVQQISKHVEKIKFRADRPFLFYIQANGEQLFAGVFSEP